MAKSATRDIVTDVLPDEPVDPRFSLANERTFLAWVRTATGFLAVAAGLAAIDLPWPDAVVRMFGFAMAGAAGCAAVLAWTRWRQVDAALAAGTPLPRTRAQAAIVVVVGGIALATMVLFAASSGRQ